MPRNLGPCLLQTARFWTGAASTYSTGLVPKRWAVVPPIIYALAHYAIKVPFFLAFRTVAPKTAFSQDYHAFYRALRGAQRMCCL